MSEIRLSKLTKVFHQQRAVDNISYTFVDGKVTCLLGPSGCGKTTLLRMIAGLETPSSGDVYFGERRVTELRVQARNIGMVFQYPVVYRGLSVFKNIELPLKGTGMNRGQRELAVVEAAELLDLKDVLNVSVDKVDQVTRQKTAVAREVARKPEILMFDEPLTNVDPSSKYKFLRSFKMLTRTTSQTIVYVTHDQTEAMTLADQIALMRDGVIVQYDSPRAVYAQPQDSFAGWFLGNPGMNFIKIEGGKYRSNSLTATLADRVRHLQTPSEGSSVTVGLRPEDVTFVETDEAGSIKARVVRSVLAVGGQLLITLDVDGIPLKAKVRRGSNFETRSTVWIRLNSQRMTVFDEHDRRIPVENDLKLRSEAAR